MENKKEDIFENTTKFNNGIKLYMFQTGSIKTKLKFIKMNHSEEPYEIPVPWFLIKHPQGDVIIDGGMPIEAALDKHKHWGDVIEAYDPSKAFCAAFTALSISFSLASGTSTQGSLFSGFKDLNVFLLSESTHSPSINILYCFNSDIFNKFFDININII